MDSAARRDYQCFQGCGDCRRTGVAPLREQAQHQLHLVPVVHAGLPSGPVRRSNFLSGVPFLLSLRQRWQILKNIDYLAA